MKKFVDDNFKGLFMGGTFGILLLSCVLMVIVKTNVVSAVSSNWKDDIILDGSVQIATSSQKTVEELLAQGIDVGLSDADLKDIIERIISTNDKKLRDYYYAELAKIKSDYDIEALIAQLENIGANILVEGEQQLSNHINSQVSK